MGALRRDGADLEVELQAEELRLAALQKAMSSSAPAVSSFSPGPRSAAAEQDENAEDEEVVVVTARRESAAASAAVQAARDHAVQSEREVAHLQSACEFARSL